MSAVMDRTISSQLNGIRLVIKILKAAGAFGTFCRLSLLYLLNAVFDLVTIIVVAMVFGGNFELSVPFLHIDDTGISEQTLTLLVGSLLLGSNALRTIVNFFSSHFVMSLQETLSNRVITDAVRADYFSVNEVGILRDSLSDIQNFCLNIIRKLLLCIQAALTLTFILSGLLLYPDQTLAITITLVLGCSVIISYFTGVIVARLANDRQMALTDRYEQAQQILRNRDLINSTGTVRLGVRDFFTANRKYSYALGQQIFLQSIPKPLVEGVLGLLILLAWGMISEFKISESFGIILFAMYRVMPSFTALYKAALDFVMYSPIIRQISAYDLSKQQDCVGISGVTAARHSFQGINLKDVECKVGSKLILSNVNEEIVPHDRVLIRGRNGSGKSTLLKLILGQLAPSGGRIYWEGESFSKELFSYIPQKPLFINGTVLDNIFAYNDEDRQTKLPIIAKYSTLLGIEDLVKEDLVVAKENSIKVSGGELQRINLMRILVEDREIIIFDEVFSNVDSTLSDLIGRLMDAHKQKTFIVISHRSSDVDLFNKVINLE